MLREPRKRQVYALTAQRTQQRQLAAGRDRQVPLLWEDSEAMSRFSRKLYHY